jgi:hypothetical protein
LEAAGYDYGLHRNTQQFTAGIAGAERTELVL